MKTALLSALAVVALSPVAVYAQPSDAEQPQPEATNSAAPDDAEKKADAPAPSDTENEAAPASDTPAEEKSE